METSPSVKLLITDLLRVLRQEWFSFYRDDKQGKNVKPAGYEKDFALALQTSVFYLAKYYAVEMMNTHWFCCYSMSRLAKPVPFLRGQKHSFLLWEPFKPSTSVVISNASLLLLPHLYNNQRDILKGPVDQAITTPHAQRQQYRCIKRHFNPCS